MRAYIDWMAQRPWLNILLIVFYYIAVVAPHKRFGAFLNDVVFKGITRDQYNLYVMILASAVLVLFAWLFIKQSSRQLERNMLWMYMVVSVVLSVLIIKYLFVINIEVIHFPQYAAFAILIFPLLRNYNSTMLWTTIAGSVDEAYQYFYLAPLDTGYYDWNDVVTNLIGAVYGLLLIGSFGIANRPNVPWYRSTGIYAFIIMVIAVWVMWYTGYMSIYPSQDSTIQLVSKELDGFWHTVPPKVTYHVVRPVEGVMMVMILWVFYSKIGVSNQSKKADVYVKASTKDL